MANKAGSVIGLVEDRDTAQQVRGALAEAGCDRDSIVILNDEARGDDLVRELVERGYKEARARQYAAAVERGGILIAAEAEDVDRAVEAMERFELRAPEELIGRAGGEEEVERAQAVEEELRVGKEQVSGGKRLVTHVTEREVAKPVTLREEEVEVERRQEGRRLSPEEAERAFREETVEMTAISERPVVSKEARVVEEVALRKRAGERQETVRDTVRRSEVEVEDVGERQRGKR